MKLKAHDLQQFDEADILRLPEPAARELCVALLVDLKEARERLEQNASNSSRPPSSRPPWEYGAKDTEDDGAQEDDKTKTPPASESADPEPDKQEGKQEPGKQTPADQTQGAEGAAKAPKASPPRHPGKQPGARGFGRTQNWWPNAPTSIAPVTATAVGRRCQRMPQRAAIPVTHPSTSNAAGLTPRVSGCGWSIISTRTSPACAGITPAPNPSAPIPGLTVSC